MVRISDQATGNGQQATDPPVGTARSRPRCPAQTPPHPPRFARHLPPRGKAFPPVGAVIGRPPVPRKTSPACRGGGPASRPVEGSVSMTDTFTEDGGCGLPRQCKRVQRQGSGGALRAVPESYARRHKPCLWAASHWLAMTKPGSFPAVGAGPWTARSRFDTLHGASWAPPPTISSAAGTAL